MLELAAAFGHEIVAEGVDSAAQGQRLLQLGCELGQGFAIAEPMLACQLPEWIAHWRQHQHWQRSLQP
jgi:EAL domain-containing protein (putative c-di-GMP-specific phosphodiesterase class I)